MTAFEAGYAAAAQARDIPEQLAEQVAALTRVEPPLADTA